MSTSALLSEKKRSHVGPLVGSVRPEAQQPACRPAVSGGIKGIIIQLFGNTRAHTHTHFRTHTKDRRITTLRIYKLTIKLTQLYTLLRLDHFFIWCLIIPPRRQFFHLQWQNFFFLQLISPHFTLFFLQQQNKGQIFS